MQTWALGQTRAETCPQQQKTGQFYTRVFDGLGANPLPSQQKYTGRDEKRGQSESLQQQIGEIGTDVAGQVLRRDITGGGVPGGVVGPVGNQAEQHQQAEAEEHESHELVQAFGSGR